MYTTSPTCGKRPNVAFWKHRFLFDDDLQLHSSGLHYEPHLDNTDFKHPFSFGSSWLKEFLLGVHICILDFYFLFF